MTSTVRLGPSTVRKRLETALSRKLKDGETVVWQGMKLARFEPRGCLIYFFAVPWTAFALLWLTLATIGISSGVWDTGIIFVLMGLPFLFVGIGMLIKPWLSFFQRGRVMFVVTDIRVLKFSHGREIKSISVPASRIKSSVLRESSDGTGTVALKLTHRVKTYGGGFSYKMELGRVQRVANADEAIAALTAKD